ncbi:hypothetical protein Tco_1040771 [Tanacetum coccineum]
MDDLQILKGSQQEKKETAAQSFIPYWNSSMNDDEEARDNFLKDVCTLLRKFSRIPFVVTPKVILIAWESFGKVKDALTDKQYRQEDIQELMSKLLEDVRNISKEFSKYINCPSWDRPLFYFDDDDDEYTVIWRRPKAITPDEPIDEPDNSLSMGDEHLDTIPSIENLVPIPSEFEGISDDTCDVPVRDDSSTFDALNNHSEILSDSNDDGTSSDDDDFEDIEYEEITLLWIVCSSLLLRFLSPSQIVIRYLRSPILLFLIQIEPDQEGLISIDNSNDSLLEIREFESFYFDDLSFPRPLPKPPDVEICLNIKPDTPVINNFNELNEDQRGGYPDFKDSRAHGFVYSFELHILSFI